VLVNGFNVDLVMTAISKRFAVDLRDCEISIDKCIIVAAGERRPRVDAHVAKVTPCICAGDQT
jgi:hypothetical protein